MSPRKKNNVSNNNNNNLPQRKKYNGDDDDNDNDYNYNNNISNEDDDEQNYYRPTKKNKKSTNQKKKKSNQDDEDFNNDDDDDDYMYNKKKTQSQAKKKKKLLYSDEDEEEEYNSKNKKKKAQSRPKKEPSKNNYFQLKSDDEEENRDEYQDEDEYGGLDDFERELEEKRKKNQIKIGKTNERSKYNDVVNNNKKKTGNKEVSSRPNQNIKTQPSSSTKKQIPSKSSGKKKPSYYDDDENEKNYSDEKENDDYDNDDKDYRNYKIPKKNKKESQLPPKPSSKKTETKVNIPQSYNNIYDHDFKKNISSVKLGDIILLNQEKSSTKKVTGIKKGLIEYFGMKKEKKDVGPIKKNTKQTQGRQNKKEEVKNDESLDQEKVKKLINQVKTVKYNGYQYKIKKEDYFIRPTDSPSKPCQTILNNESAAIKKCEEIFAKLGPNQKWIDPDFGPQEKGTGRENCQSLYGGTNVPAGNVQPESIDWYPIGRMSEDAKFFENGTESNDVVQGGLGDCWFISALSVIATKDYLLKGEFSDSILSDGIIDDEETIMLSTGVYPPIFHYFRTKGIFVFKFYKNFQWRYVIVDDRIPCLKVMSKNQTPSIIYAKCRSNSEFWVPLIEKAYAKMHGSYNSLVSGFIDDGLVDLTGLTAKKISIDEKMVNNNELKDELWEQLKKYSSLTFDEEDEEDDERGLKAKYFLRNKSMMGCSVDPSNKSVRVEQEIVIDNNKCGILASHAYSILDCFEIPKPSSKKKRKCSRLLRIRNPWGRKESKLKWCDDSDEILKNQKRIEEVLNKKYEDTHERVYVNQEDGCFLMCFSDFLKVFNKLFICINFPPSYVGFRAHGEWVKKSESGGLPIHNTPEEHRSFQNNPQYYLQVNSECKFFMSLLQNDGRLTGTKFPFANSVKKVCLVICKTKGKNRIQDCGAIMEKTPICQRRDICLEMTLSKGDYIIMPCTLESTYEGNYCVEIYVKDSCTKDNAGNPNEPLEFQNIVFEKLGGRECTYELIKEGRKSQITHTDQNKMNYIMSIIKTCINDEDTANYEEPIDPEEEEREKYDEY